MSAKEELEIGGKVEIVQTTTALNLRTDRQTDRRCHSNPSEKHPVGTGKCINNNSNEIPHQSVMVNKLFLQINYN